MPCTAGEKFQQALQLIQTIHEHFVAFSEKEESASVAGAKVATVLTLAVLKKIASGKNHLLSMKKTGRILPMLYPSRPFSLRELSTVSLSFSYMRNTYALPPHRCRELHLTKL